MHKILMILTKDRRDCVDISLRLHERGGSFDFFDKVVFLLNDVTSRHMRFIDQWIDRHPKVSCDKILGDGSRPQGIAAMQNRCIEKYPGAFYAKTDEDVFVPNGWAERMWSAYQAHQMNENLALITPLLPNNSYGLYVLLHQFYPKLLEEHRQRFHREPTPERDSFTWHSPAVAEWATRKFINLDEANALQHAKVSRSSRPEAATSDIDTESDMEDIPFTTAGAFHLFREPFSIGCIAYDYRHIAKMGGIPDTDEPGWCAWIQQHQQINVLDCRQIALHYTFFVQQEWLDRSSLLEDIRKTNLPEATAPSILLHGNRLIRLTKQVPRIISRKLFDNQSGQFSQRPST